MRKVDLRMNEKQKYEVIKELVDHGGNKKRAALQLHVSERQINRLIKKYKEEGKSAFIHGNRDKSPVNKMDNTTSTQILTLYKEEYYDFNFNHFKECLEKNHGIKVSYNFLYNLLMSNGILSPRAQKATRRKKKKEELAKKKAGKDVAITEKQIDEIVNYEVALEDSHPRQEKPKYFGEIIEMDGSIHNWFGTEKACLHLAIDVSTGIIVGAYFCKQETLYGYYEVLKQILENWGIPLKFRTDNRTVFAYNSLNKEKRTPDKDVLTQFGYACSILGIELETTSVSQAKGTIERANQTFQGRLVNELKRAGINDIDGANKYLLEVFVPNLNKTFGRPSAGSAMADKPTKEKINTTLALIAARKIDTGNCVKYYNKYYLTYDKNGELVCLKPHTKVLVIQTYDKQLLLSCDEKLYALKELQDHKSYSEAMMEKPVEKKENKYIPPMSHPWKYNSFMAQQRRAHQKKIYSAQNLY